MKFNNQGKKVFRKWASIFAIYTFVAIFFSSNTLLQNQITNAPYYFLKLEVASVYIWFLLTPLILLVYDKFPLDEDRFKRNLLIHIAASGIFVLIKVTSGMYTFPFFGFPLPAALDSSEKLFRYLFFRNVNWDYFNYLIIVGVIHGVNYYNKSRERKFQALRLEAQLAQSNLRVLQMQLHPHFLFNTHNAIITLMHKNTKMAEKMLVNLSDLLRISLQMMEEHEVPLEKELDFLSKYLEIEKIRFQDRLKVTMEIDPETLDAAVPNMILQPLVENAIKHGIAPQVEGGEIKIQSARLNNHLRLSVSDNGAGYSSGGEIASAALPNGIGLSNTKARLAQLYKEKSDLEVRTAKGAGLEVKILIPFRLDTSNENAVTNEVRIDDYTYFNSR